MDEQGIDRALMFPTLASLVEERMRDDPELIHAVIHALNEWIHETWTFDYEDRIFATPVITLPDRREGDRGARVGASSAAPRRCSIRPAPVPGFRGPRSFGLPEFDPFWEKVVEHDILVAMHSSDSGYERYTNDWMGSGSEMLPFQPRRSACCRRGGRSRTPWRRWSATARCRASRSSRSRSIENGSSWVEPLLKNMADIYKKMPQDFLEDPIEVVQAQHLHQPVLGGGPRRAGRADRRRPRAVRLRLPPSRGPRRPDLLRRRARRLPDEHRQDHGRQPGELMKVSAPAKKPVSA